MNKAPSTTIPRERNPFPTFMTNLTSNRLFSLRFSAVKFYTYSYTIFYALISNAPAT
jgi:hypothetical protein